MTGFLVIAGGMTLAVLAWLSLPMLQTARGTAQAAATRRSVAVLALLITASAAGLYAFVGQPQLLTDARALPQGPVPAPDLTQAMSALAERLEHEPQDGLGWMTLARARFELGLYADAARAYARAHRLLGDEPQLLAEYAEALALQNDGAFTANARALLARALHLQPDNRHALWLTGLAAYADRERGTAVEHWRKALTDAPQGSAEAQRLEEAIAAAGVQGRKD